MTRVKELCSGKDLEELRKNPKPGIRVYKITGKPKGTFIKLCNGKTYDN